MRKRLSTLENAIINGPVAVEQEEYLLSQPLVTEQI
jgi:hypothetical protein